MSKDPKSAYYDVGGIETLEVIKAKLTPEQYRGYLLGNAIKYACRMNFKGCAERDAEKLAIYSAEWRRLRASKGVGVSDKGNVVIAGDEVFATIDSDLQDDELTRVRWAMVVQFDSREAFHKAWKAGACEFTIFEDRKS